VTKKKKAGKNEKRTNQTAHERALTNPRARETIGALRATWDNLTPDDRGEKLNDLIRLGCSVRGLARELDKPESTIRRYIALAHSSESGGNWIATIERTLAKKRAKEREVSRIEALRESKAMFEKNGELKPVPNDKSAANDAKHKLSEHKTQQTRQSPHPVSRGAEEPSQGNGVASEKGRRAEEPKQKIDLVERYRLQSGGVTPKRIQRLQAIVESIAPRPYRDARSMKRQGRPLPPTDPN